MKLIVLVANTVFLALGSVTSPYTYREFGADWGTKYPTCLHGQSQSPVNFVPAKIQKSSRLSIQGFGYSDIPSVTIERQLHTVVSEFTEGELHVTFENGTNATFLPLQLHFHAPSEHTLLS